MSVYLFRPKTCSCGRVHQELPEKFEVLHDEDLGGIYFDCECGSTLVVPFRSLEKEKEAA